MVPRHRTLDTSRLSHEAPTQLATSRTRDPLTLSAFANEGSHTFEVLLCLLRNFIKSGMDSINHENLKIMYDLAEYSEMAK